MDRGLILMIGVQVALLYVLSHLIRWSFRGPVAAWSQKVLHAEPPL